MMATSLDMAQDVVWCHLCPSNQFLKCPAELHCQPCSINLCQGCAGKHLLSKKSTIHDIVEYRHRTRKPKYPECQTHSGRRCELQCKQCQVPVCATCVTDSHKKHDVVEISTSTDSKIANHTPGALSIKQLLDKSEVITTTDSGTDPLYRMNCVGSEEVWISGDDTTIKRVTIRGELLQKVTDVCRSTCPLGLSVTSNGAVLYCDPLDVSVQMIEDNAIHTVITFQDWWVPFTVCASSSGDILILMTKEDNAKLVRYSGSVMKQEIQHDKSGQPLFSSFYSRYIEENRNRDICVQNADNIVVVNRFGQLRFRYDGKHPENKYTTFTPRGIATDSKCRILVADRYNNCVHVIDKDGQFLCYINNCDDSGPVTCLSVDSRDRLWVGFEGGEIKVIQYMITQTHSHDYSVCCLS